MVQAAPCERPTTATPQGLGSDRVLRPVTIFFAAAVLLHNLDHLRRGSDSLAPDVFRLGSAAMAIEVAVVIAVFMRHHLAPPAAASAGFSLALGYAFVHLTPRRSWLSDSFFGGDVDALSWGAAVLEITAALALGAAGALLLRRGRLRGASGPEVGRAPTPTGARLRRALRHPVVAVFIVGNLLVFSLSLPGA